MFIGRTDAKAEAPIFGNLMQKTDSLEKTLSDIFLTLQYSTLKSTVVKDNSWHPGAGVTLTTRRVTDWRRERRWRWWNCQE